MNKYKKITMVMCSLGLILLLTGVTYSFFNYTKTGNANNLETGSISFNIDEGEAISLTNVFPMTASEAEEATLDTLTIGISGSTTYASGEEFLISIVDVTKLNNKEIPINYIATYEETTGNSIGTEEDDYFTERESKSANIYLLNETGRVKEDKQVLVGFIKGGTAGIDGTLTIKAYVDADRIAITDTPEESSDWVAGRQVFSTTEWNSLKGNSAISFKIKAESYTKLWVEEPEPDDVTPSTCFDKQTIKIYTVNPNMTQTELNDCITYINSKNISFDNNGTAEDFCLGTAKLNGQTFSIVLISDQKNNYFSDMSYMEDHNIVASEIGIKITHYDSSCGSDLVLPNYIKTAKALINPNITQSEINDCVDYFANTLGYSVNTSNNETFETYCDGTGTMWGRTFQNDIDDRYSENQLTYLKNHNIIVDDETKKYPVLVLGDGYTGVFESTSKQYFSSVSINNNLLVINSHGLDVGLADNVNSIVIPQSVKYIGNRSSIELIFSDYQPHNVELNILGKPFIDAFAMDTWPTIKYGGTCQELYDNSSINYTGKPNILIGPYDQQWDVITTDTNTCKVVSAYYD